jgi:hypothetical protein
MTLFDFLHQHPIWSFLVFVIGWLFLDAVVVNICNTWKQIVAMRVAASVSETEEEETDEEPNS